MMISYNNCSRSSGNTDGGSLSSSLLNSGSTAGLSGSFSLQFFDSNPGCPEDWGKATEQLSLNFDSSQSFWEKSSCGDLESRSVNFSEVRNNGYNSSVVFYNQKIFVRSLLHEGVQGHPYYKEFCFNHVLQQDFLIQYIDESPAGQPGTGSIASVGITMNGPLAKTPGVMFNGGFLDIYADGSKLFMAENGTFEVQIDPPSASSDRKARYIKNDGTIIPLACWFQYKINKNLHLRIT